ncbi:MAG: tetraacyldisaccharide 4'-kinase [Candidatus Fermentibacteraceae bacterium]|nr:tetraacyldisaccharide 4'-kinase [Candidatus Fermentibacteraceae bacterium]MBN2607673.1 tetraacyldisaccharide 4'-kinase [Candidatus Fermentibacteraceae bacterium]
MERPDRLFGRIVRREGWYAWLGWCLMPAGWLYGLAASVRRKWFESGDRQIRLPVPVISVGNIEVGGTGKTPVTIWLANRITGMGYRVAVVARNFGRRTSSCRVRLDSDDVRKDFTDEVLLLAESLLGRSSVYAGRSKTEAAIRAYRGEKPDIILVDDGFQHLGLHRDIELLVLDFASPFGQGGLLPSGTLREFPSVLSRADHIWINRIPTGMSAEWIKRRLIDYNWKAPVQFSRVMHTGVRLVGGGTLSRLPSRTLLAFCGIGRPESFRNSLEDVGIRLEGLEVFPDHHVYTVEDIEHLRRLMESTGASGLITTAKDAVKLYGLPGTGDIMIQTMNLEVKGAVPELMNDIQHTIENYWTRKREDRDDID